MIPSFTPEKTPLKRPRRNKKKEAEELRIRMQISSDARQRMLDAHYAWDASFYNLKKPYLSGPLAIINAYKDAVSLYKVDKNSARTKMLGIKYLSEDPNGNCDDCRRVWSELPKGVGLKFRPRVESLKESISRRPAVI